MNLELAMLRMLTTRLMVITEATKPTLTTEGMLVTPPMEPTTADTRTQGTNIMPTNALFSTEPCIEHLSNF